MSRTIPRYVHIESQDGKGLIRDTFSMGILNINSIALGAARQRKQIAIKRLSQERDDKLSFKETQKDVEALKTDVLEIKSMLSEIINNLQRKSSYGSS